MIVSTKHMIQGDMLIIRIQRGLISERVALCSGFVAAGKRIRRTGNRTNRFPRAPVVLRHQSLVIRAYLLFYQTKMSIVLQGCSICHRDAGFTGPSSLQWLFPTKQITKSITEKLRALNHVFQSSLLILLDLLLSFKFHEISLGKCLQW
jgi:hypothetical protein